MSKTILAFGDSNTYGFPPMKSRTDNPPRFPVGTRWPTVVAAETGWTVIEAGLPGRSATGQTDVIMGAYAGGPVGLRIALNSCDNIDALVIMMGTNDQKAQFGLSAQAITGAVSGLLSIAKSEEMQDKHGGYEILLVCPPAVKELGALKEEFFGAEAKSAALPDLYAALADNWDIDYFNANTVIETNDDEGVHLDAESQKALGQAIASGLQASLV